MLCGLRLFRRNLPSKYVRWLLKQFNFGSFFDLETGLEIPTPNRKNNDCTYQRMIWRKAIYRNLEILLGWKIDALTGKEVYNLKVAGSVHKYACGGDNSGSFSAMEAMIAIDELCQTLQLDKAKTKIISIEIGVNVIVNFCVFSYLDQFLLRYWRIPFQRMDEGYKGSCIGFEAILAHHSIKAYAKKKNVLRYELHYSDMQELRSNYKLYTLQDLSEELINKIAEEKLIDKWSRITLLDGIYMEEKYLPKLKKKDKDIFLKYSNNKYLIQLDYLIKAARLKDNNKEVNRLYKADARNRQRFERILKEHGKDKMHMKLQVLIKDEIISLKEKCPKFDIGVKLKKKTKTFNVDRYTQLIERARANNYSTTKNKLIK